MGRMIRLLFTAACVLVAASNAVAQARRFVYPAPPPDAYRVVTDVEFGKSSSGAPLRMDVYRPSSGTRHPTLVFFNIATGAERSNPFYAAWAEIAASKGITAILPDLGMESFVQDFVALHQFLARPMSGETGIDPTRVAVYAGSGNVFRALPIVQDRRSTVVKSAVMFYGGAEVSNFRPDLPVLIVRAGLDRPALNTIIASLVSTAVSQNAPVTLLNHAAGRHAFEMVNDDDATRRVIDQALEFVRVTTSPEYQAAIRKGVAEATAAGHVTAGRTKEAAEASGGLVAARPDDASLRLAYGEALLGDRQFAAACAELETLKGKGLGSRDLGIPAARACMQKGDAEAAIGWLQSIPSRFRPTSLRNDPIFAAIRDRAEFQALFESR